MRPGRGGPSGVCDKYSGAQRDYCESLERECLEKGSKGGDGDGGSSNFDLVDCDGNLLSTNGRFCSSMVGHLAENWNSCSAAGKGGKTQIVGEKPSDENGAEGRSEKKKWAPKGATGKKSKKSQGILLVNKSTAPSRYKDGALVVANIRIPEHREAILGFWKKHPSEGMALLNVGYTDEKSRKAAVASVASVLNISEDKASAIVESKFCFTLSWKDKTVVPRILVAPKKASPAKPVKKTAPAEAKQKGKREIALIDVNKPASRYGDGIIVVMNGVNTRDAKRILKLIKEEPDRNIYIIDGSTAGGASVVKAVLGIDDKEDAKKAAESFGIYSRGEGGKFARVDGYKDESKAAQGSKAEEEVGEEGGLEHPSVEDIRELARMQKRHGEIAEELKKDRLAAKERRIEDAKFNEALSEVRAMFPEKGKSAKAANGPTGFVEASTETMNGIIKEISSQKYPVMVVVGQEAKKPGQRSCQHCVELKKRLADAQGSGKMNYHRLVFVNFNDPSTLANLKRLGIDDNFRGSSAFVPQLFVFEGGKPVGPKSAMDLFMNCVNLELDKAVGVGETQLVAARDEKKKEEAEAEKKKVEAEAKKKKEEAEAKQKKEEAEAKKKKEEAEAKKKKEEAEAKKKKEEAEAEKKKVEAEKKKESEEIDETKEVAEPKPEEEPREKSKLELRREKLKGISDEEAKVRRALASYLLTDGNVGTKAENTLAKGKSMFVVVTSVFDELFKESYNRFSDRNYIIDANTEEGRKLAAKLGITRLGPDERYHNWELKGGWEKGAFLGKVVDGGGEDHEEEEMVERSSLSPSRYGFVYLDEAVLKEHWNAGVEEAILVVGDPTSAAAGDVMSRLYDERKELGGSWPLFWVPHHSGSDNKKLLLNFSIPSVKPPVDDKVKVWRVECSDGSCQAKRYRHSGFVEATSSQDAQRLLTGNSERVLLVLGRSNGKGAEATAELRKTIVENQWASSGKLEIHDKPVGSIVYMEKEAFVRAYGHVEDMMRLLGDSPNFPRAFVLHGKVSDRRMDELNVKKIFGVEPVDATEVKEPEKEKETGEKTWIRVEPREAILKPTLAAEDYRVSQLKASEPMDLNILGNKKGIIVFVWGPAEAMKGDVSRVVKALTDLDEHNGVFLATDGASANQLSALKAFKLDGKSLPEKGVARCQRGSVKEVWSCKPYDFPE